VEGEHRVTFECNKNALNRPARQHDPLQDTQVTSRHPIHKTNKVKRSSINTITASGPTHKIRRAKSNHLTNFNSSFQNSNSNIQTIHPTNSKNGKALPG
jgi:hypothetical protein